MMYDVIIVGAGPAGLFAAIQAAGRKKKVLLLEKKEKPGKKLLITGSGQCNLTHIGPVREFLPFYGQKGSFIGASLQQFQPENLLDFFIKRGLNFYTTAEGKYFPVSNRASDVLDILLKECAKQDVLLITSERVFEIEKSSKGFWVKSEKSIYETKKLILTTGGMSYPGTGSEGDGYGLAKSLGHTIIPPRPALSPVIIRDFSMASLAGLSFKNLEISLFRDHKKQKNLKGDLLLTHSGLSGPAILNNSRDLRTGDLLEINFVSPQSSAELNQTLLDTTQKKGGQRLINLFRETQASRRLIKAVFEKIGLSQELKTAELNKKQRKQLVQELTACQMIIKKVQGFSHAMVTAGGIDLKQLSPRTMESTICPGLFFAGEILDIDGDTGGYNLQASFSTACAAGQSV